MSFGRRQLALGLCAALMVLTTSGAVAEQVLTVWLNTQTPQATELMNKQLIPKFEKEHPGVKVEFTPVSWNDRGQKLKVAFAGGVFPDVYEIGSDSIPGDLANGYPLAIDERLARWEGRSQFIPEALRPTYWNGRQYGVPYTLTGRHLFYLDSLFEEVGLNSAQPPRSWEDLKSATRKLLKVNPDGTTKRLGFQPGWSDPQALYWYMWQNKAEIVDEVTGTALFNSLEGIEALEFVRDIYQMQGPPRGAVPRFHERGMGIFYCPTAAMVDQIRHQAPQLFDELHMFTVERKGSTVWPMYVNSLAISTQSKHPDLAWEFITWFSQIENIIPYLAEVGMLSPNTRALNTAYIRETMKPVLGVYTEAQYARRNFISPTGGGNSIFRNLLSKVLNNQISPQEALLQAEFEWNKVRDEVMK